MLVDDPTLNKRWVTRVEGESPLYEWMESGVLRQVAQDEQGTPNVEEVRGRGDGGEFRGIKDVGRLPFPSRVAELRRVLQLPLAT